MSLIKDTIGLIKDEEENPNIYKGLYTNNFYKGLVSSDDKQDTEKPNESVKINDPNYDNYLRNGCIKIGKIYKTLYYYNGDFMNQAGREKFMPILWQDVAAEGDAAQFRRFFEVFAASCDWWEARVREVQDHRRVPEMMIVP